MLSGDIKRDQSHRKAEVLKKETLEQVFPSELCEISKNTFSYRTPPVAAFWTLIKFKMTESIDVLPCLCYV